MKITTTSRHYDLTPALREYAESKIAHLTTYFDNLTSAHIIFGVEKYRHFVEVTIHTNGKDFVAHDVSDDMYASVDGVVEKLERQIRKHKGKLYRKKSPKLSQLPQAQRPEASETDTGDKKKAQMTEISPADPIEFPRLRLSEALKRLNQNGKEFSIFSNRTTKRLNVLYKREDGTIGIIEA